jgi:hypothetical protein
MPWGYAGAAVAGATLGPKLLGKSGQGTGSSNQTITTQNPISEAAQPYVENLLGRTQSLVDTPYQTYPGQRTADFTDLQNQSFQGVQGLGVAPQLGQATNYAGVAGLGGFGVAGQATNQGFQNQVGGYMNPYLQYSLAPQLAEANRQYDISGAQQQSNATRSGAFGGSREAIMAAENERNRNMGLNSIIGQGYNTAFTNAQQQYNQNLQNQLSGFGLANTAASNLGNLGQTQFGQQQAALGMQNQFGAQQQQQQQNVMNQQYQDFLAQRQDPYTKLAFQQNMMSGIPLTSSTQNVYSNPSLLSQVAGLGTAAAGAYGLANMGSKTAAKGGAIKEPKRPAGLAELAIHRMG